MKNRFRFHRPLLCAALAAAVMLPLSACKFNESDLANTSNTVATTAKAITPLIPTTVNTKLAVLIAKHPGALPYLGSIANGFESVADFTGKLPTPDAISSKLAPWVDILGFVPTYGPEIVAVFNGALDIYKVAYPATANTGAAVSEFAELVRSYQQKATTAATAFQETTRNGERLVLIPQRILNRAVSYIAVPVAEIRRGH